jgi:hypothetical protein
MGISILSYDGRIHFGIITDEGLVPDPGRIVDRFGEEFAKLMWLTLMSPWATSEDEIGTQSSKSRRIPKRFRAA